MASSKQRAVTGVTPGRWQQFGRALWDWRENELGYQVRGKFAADRHINIRLVQDLENNYRQTYTRWKLEHEAAPAYEITYESMLAFLRTETDTFTRAETAARHAGPAPAGGDMLSLPPAPYADASRAAAARPYAEAIWRRYLDLPRRVTDPSASHLGLHGDDARAWNGTAGRWPIGDRVWMIADLQRRDAGRTAAVNASSA